MREIVRQKLAAAVARLHETEPNVAPAVAVDFETFYRTERVAKKQKASPCTVELQGNWGYCRHPEWEAYMVSMYSPACPALGLPEIAYVGDPAKAPWELLAGRVWLSHNRNFDRHVYERLVELGLVPAIAYSVWHDTADLAVASHLPRALANAIKIAFGLTMDKEARADMDGVRWKDVAPEFVERMLAYALEDAALCWLLWATYSPKWPEIERWASLHTGNIEFRGIPVDRARVERDIGILEAAAWSTRNRIPWVDTEDEDTGKPYALRSKKALDRECLKCGVPPPETTSQKSKDFLDWLDQYGDKVPAIYELARYRRIDRALSVYKALLARIRPDGRAALGLKYMGAEKTGRWSGANKFNLQNLMKSPLAFGSEYQWLDYDRDQDCYVYDSGVPAQCDTLQLVDIRRCLTASPGRKLIIPDLSQIEPRVLNWIVGNKEFLRLCASGMSPYEAHARAFMGWTGGKLKKESPGLYALAKARVLALGYGAGWQKFIEMARGYCANEREFLAVFAVTPCDEQVYKFLDYLEWMVENMNSASSKAALTAWPELDQQTRNIWVNAWTQVQDFRRTNPLIADRKSGLWARLDREFKASAQDGGIYENELPSGRMLKYFGVGPAWGWSCRSGNPMARPQRTYGGLLCENLVQATARDCFLHGIKNLEDAGYEVLFHVHDEAVVDAPLDADPKDCIRLLTTMPDWAKSLPVGSEAEESAHYKK